MLLLSQKGRNRQRCRILHAQLLEIDALGTNWEHTQDFFASAHPSTRHVYDTTSSAKGPSTNFSANSGTHEKI